MARTSVRISAKDRRRQILAVATKLFARQGFQGTKTRQIAQSASMNEALIFRHFPTKEDLYWAILDEKCRARRGRELLERRLNSGAKDLDMFASIAEDILRRNLEDPTFVRLWLFSALEHHRLSQRLYKRYATDYHRTLANYIQQRIQTGQFRQVDPRMAARAFLAMVIQTYLSEALFGSKGNRRLEPHQVGRTLAGIWLEGMLALNGRFSSTARPRATRKN